MATISTFGNGSTKSYGSMRASVAKPDMLYIKSLTSVEWKVVPGASSYSLTVDPSLGTVTISGTSATFSTAMSAGTAYNFVLTASGGGSSKSTSFTGRYYSYTGSSQSFNVPTTTVNLTAYLSGAAGGGYGSGRAAAGAIVGTMPVSVGQNIYVYVGGRGGDYCRNTYTEVTCSSVPGNGAAGYNGGGTGAANGSAYQGTGAGGGGATDIRLNATALSDRIMVAGGSGGGGPGSGGLGGGLVGGAGANIGSSGAIGGGGGTQSAGGSGGSRPGYPGVDGNSGSLGVGGNGGACNVSWCMGGHGGGGGYYGGGGGEAGDESISNSSSYGGGGSSYSSPIVSSVTHYQGGGSTDHGFATLVWRSA